MVTETEHLLLCLAEECDEVGQRVMKALRFGLAEVQPGQSLSNAERIADEMRDLVSVALILCDRDVLRAVLPQDRTVHAKAEKIARYMEIARREGVLT